MPCGGDGQDALEARDGCVDDFRWQLSRSYRLAERLEVLSIADECDLGETAARMAISARESDLEKRQLPIKAGREADLCIRLKPQGFKARQEETANRRQVSIGTENIAIIHIAASPALPEKLMEGMVQPIQIGNRCKLVHLVAQCQEIRFAAIESGDIEEA